MYLLPGLRQVDTADLQTEVLEPNLDTERLLHDWVEKKTFMPRPIWLQALAIK